MENLINFSSGAGPWQEEAKELFSGLEWTSANQSVANVFVVLTTYALPLERIIKIIDALYSIDYSKNIEVIEKTLAYFIKQKAIRKRKERGVVLYEVNLK